jgi:hypothetical protein
MKPSNLVFGRSLEQLTPLSVEEAGGSVDKLAFLVVLVRCGGSNESWRLHLFTKK